MAARALIFGAIVGVAACGLELSGSIAPDASTIENGKTTLDGASDGNPANLPDGADIDANGGTGIDGATDAGPIAHAKTWSGTASGNATVTVVNVTADSGLYLAAISSKGPVNVTSIAGLGATWTRARAQCSGRDQTMVELWTAANATTNGAVSAALQGSYLNVVMTVSRYVNATKIGGALSSNTYGPNGACNNGSDTSNPTLSVPKSGNGRLFGAAAIRLRSHEPGANNTELFELHEGSSGDVAGLALLDTTGNVLSGTLGSDTDWALAGVELLP